MQVSADHCTKSLLNSAKSLDSRQRSGSGKATADIRRKRIGIGIDEWRGSHCEVLVATESAFDRELHQTPIAESAEGYSRKPLSIKTGITANAGLALIVH